MLQIIISISLILKHNTDSAQLRFSICGNGRVHQEVHGCTSAVPAGTDLEAVRSGSETRDHVELGNYRGPDVPENHLEEDEGVLAKASSNSCG